VARDPEGSLSGLSSPAKKLTRSQGVILEHTNAQHLPNDVRVGFSLHNFTGLPLRYLQATGGKRSLQYVQDGERTLLNFAALKTVLRNNTIVEAFFSVQQKGNNPDSKSHDAGNAKSGVGRVGHKVSFQVCGFQWLMDVHADTLGLRFSLLETITGRLDPYVLVTNWQIKNALLLATEVVPISGGRVLRVSSVFRVKNETNHAIEVFAHEDSASNPLALKDPSYTLGPGEVFHIPVALLQSSVRHGLKQNKGTSLGFLWVRPASRDPVLGELSIGNAGRVDRVNFSSDSVDLASIVHDTAALYSSVLAGDDLHQKAKLMQLSCLLRMRTAGIQDGDSGHTEHVSSFLSASSLSEEKLKRVESSMDASSGLKNDKVPPFCYVVDVRRSDRESTNSPTFLRQGESDGTDPSSGQLNSRVPRSWLVKKKRRSVLEHDPVFYTLGE